MSERQHFFAESRAESTTTSSTFQNKATLTFTGDASTDYFLLWSAMAGCSSTTERIHVRLQNTTDSVTEGLFSIEPKDTSDYFAVGGLAKFNFGASPASKSFVSQFATPNAVATVKIKESTIFALKKGPDDQHVENTSDQTTTFGTSQDAVVLTWTPPVAGDYWIIASGEMRSESATVVVDTKLLHDGGAGYGEDSRRALDVNNFCLWGTHVKLNLPASSQTFRLQWSARTAGTAVHCRNAQILAIRLDAFANALQYNEARTETTTTSTTFVDKATVTFTPAARNHLLLGCGLFGNAAITESGTANFIDTTTPDTYQEPTEEISGSGDRSWMLAAQRISLPASSKTWKTQFKAETSSNAAVFAESAIGILDLEEAPSGVPKTNKLCLLGVG